jgi:hypothetical protein
MGNKGAFVAKRHLCWFSRSPEYRNMQVEEVFQKNPDYILWCYENLKYIRFPMGLSNRIKKYRQSKITPRPDEKK